MTQEDQKKIAAAVRKHLTAPEIPAAVRDGSGPAYTYLWGTGNQMLKEFMDTRDHSLLPGAKECLEAAKLDFKVKGTPVLRNLYATLLSDLGIVLTEQGQFQEAKVNFIEALAVATDDRCTDLIAQIQDNIAILSQRAHTRL